MTYVGQDQIDHDRGPSINVEVYPHKSSEINDLSFPALTFEFRNAGPLYVPHGFRSSFYRVLGSLIESFLRYPNYLYHFLNHFYHR